MNPLDIHTRRADESLLAEAAKLREQYAGQPEKHPCGLAVGDVFKYRRYVSEDDEGNPAPPVLITVLRGPEARPDVLRRMFIAFWVRENATGREGWMSFGLGARVRYRIVPGDVTPAATDDAPSTLFDSNPGGGA